MHYILSVFLFFLVIFFQTVSFATENTLKCSKFLFQQPTIPLVESCTDFTAYEPEIAVAIDNNDMETFEILMRFHVGRYNNLGGIVVKFPSGIKTIYRSAMLSEDPKCLWNLVKQRNVMNIVNVYREKYFDMTPWIKREKDLFRIAGGKNYLHFDNLDYNYKTPEQKDLLINQVAEIIHTIEQLEGNVVIHCLGGEHLTSIVFGTIGKCFNKVPIESIIQEYKCHSVWESDDKPGGYIEKNVEFIRDFPCAKSFNNE
jgi:hypothetical protein